MSELAPLKTRVLCAIYNTSSDFNLTDTLVQELGASRAEIVGVLDELWHTDEIRHPVGFTTAELEWWRHTSRGYTRGEKKRMFLARIIGMSPLSDGTPHG